MVEAQREGAVAKVLLARAEKANALDSALLERLKAELEKLRGDPDVRVVVLGARGRTFCAGADLGELERLDADTAAPFVERIHRVCEAIRALPVPVVAQLQGAVIGGGLEIAAACDLRVAARGTRFAMPEVRLGIPSVVEAALLPRLMGAGRAAWLVLTGEAIDAERAHDWGLVEALCGEAELDQTVARVVESLLAGDREALRLQKELLHMWQEQPLSASVAASLGRFAQAVAGGVPAQRIRHTISRAKGPKEH
jgi:enoyl-CoA hydratase